MEDLVVTRLWMAGVVAMMSVFGVIALIGYLKSRSKKTVDLLPEK